MEPYFGLRYKLYRDEHFDDLLIFLDIGYIQRQIGAKLKPTQSITDNGDGTYTLYFSSLLTTFEIVFTPGVEFDEVNPRGVKVKAVLTIEGNKLIHTQREDNGRTLHHVYEFTPDTMTITTTAKGLSKVVKRYFKLTT